MSKLQHNVPTLSIGAIEKMHLEIKMADAGNGWLLTNREGNVTKKEHEDSLYMFLLQHKAKHQIEVLLNRLKKIKELLTDFDNKNLEKYIKEFHEDYDEGKFDPYVHLGYYITTDGIDDLPEKAEVFFEMIHFCQTLGIRKKAMSDAFERFFGDIEFNYMTKGEDGEVVMVPESQMPVEQVAAIKERAEIRAGFEEIEAQHLFDNYDKWIVAIARMVENRVPFNEILTLFKD